MKKIVLKDDGFADSPDSPTGYKYIGYDGGSLSQKSGSTITNIVPTYLEVDISSAQILSMGTTPIELIAPQGADKYCMVSDLIIEETGGSVGYDFTGLNMALNNNDGDFTTAMQQLSSGENEKRVFRLGALFLSSYLNNGTTDQPWLYVSSAINSGLYLTTDTEADPTSGNGTMKVKIWYTVRTFG